MIQAASNRSANFTRTNTLRQFNWRDIVGVDAAVGRIPIVFYVKERPDKGCGAGGRRGIIFGGADFEDLCYVFPQNEHAEWCQTNYAMKYDGLETLFNEEIDETSFWRNKGILDMSIERLRTYFNGNLMFRADYKLQDCPCDRSYPIDDDNNTTTPVQKPNIRVEQKSRPARIKTKPSGCSTCGKRKK